MEFVPQIKDLLKSKDNDDDSVLVYAARSKDAAMFNTAMTFVENHLSPHEVK